jgi:uncharacterized protein (DUF1697 family)
VAEKLHGWVALLRAVNVGGRGRVPMAELHDLLGAAGYGSVRTYIQSGNVLFEHPGADRDALAADLEARIAEAFGATATAVLRTFEEIRRVAASHPFGADTSRTYVTFLAREPDPAALARLAVLDVAPDLLAFSGSEVFLRYPSGVQEARLTGAQLERAAGVAGTSRNWRTVTRLAELA